MTTEIRYNFIENISCRNALLFIAPTPAFRLAAIVWTVQVSDTVMKERYNCLDYALRKLTTNFLDRELWLIAAHKALQPDNRITRHNGLWKSLQKAGVIIPQGEFIEEYVLASENRLRVFGAVHFNLDQLEAVHAVMTATQSVLVFLPKSQAEDTVRLLAQRGWAMTNSKPPEEVLDVVSAHSGLVVDAYGEFDDPEVSVAAIGKKEMFRDFNLLQ